MLGLDLKARNAVLRYSIYSSIGFFAYLLLIHDNLNRLALLNLDFSNALLTMNVFILLSVYLLLMLGPGLYLGYKNKSVKHFLVFLGISTAFLLILFTLMALNAALLA